MKTNLSMKIKLVLHTTLQKISQRGLLNQMEVEIPAGSTVAVLLNTVHISLDIENTLMVVNGRNVDIDHQLLDGDQVHLIPAISGGK